MAKILEEPNVIKGLVTKHWLVDMQGVKEIPGSSFSPSMVTIPVMQAVLMDNNILATSQSMDVHHQSVL